MIYYNADEIVVRNMQIVVMTMIWCRIYQNGSDNFRRFI